MPTRGDRIGRQTAAKIYEITIEHAEAGERITKTEAERLVAELRRKAMARTGRDFPIIVIQEAGLDGFRVHRVLQSEGIESHVVDARVDPDLAPAEAGEDRPDRERAGGDRLFQDFCYIFATMGLCGSCQAPNIPDIDFCDRDKIRINAARKELLKLAVERWP